MDENNKISSVCDFPYNCTYSKVLHKYICCKFSSLKNSIIKYKNYLINNKQVIDLINKPNNQNKFFKNPQINYKYRRTINQSKRLFFFNN